MNVCTIRTVKHEDQRYDTAGYWMLMPSGEVLVRVSRMKDWRYEALVGVHELVEALLCRYNGITTKQADEFDMTFKGEGEPGDDPACPYRKEHFFATSIERLLAAELGVDWAEYDKAVAAL